MITTRRRFVQTALGTSLAWTLPSFLIQTLDALHAANSVNGLVTGKDSTVLVVLQLAGGNDGLNTVVPFANDDYRRARPKLGLKPDDVLKLNDTCGLHPSLTGFKELYDAGQLGIIQAVGYPNPNRSHFRSTEIWHTASDANQIEHYGWLGRYFDHACAGCPPTVGISVGRQMPQAFHAARPIGVALDGTGGLGESGDESAIENGRMAGPRKSSDDLRDGHKIETDDGSTIDSLSGRNEIADSPLDFLERVAVDARSSNRTISEISSRSRNHAAYPVGRLANGLKLIARLIAGGMPTRVYYASQGGYDTHSNQIGTHARLLKELGDSLKSFVADLREQGNIDRIVVMTFSEFGRRVAENASLGTDHGAAAPLFVIGSKIRAGIHGTPTGLSPSDLYNGDVRFKTDFRNVYASVLEKWLQADSLQILGKRFEALPIIG